MPATSIRDLVIKDDDLVVGTHGRGFWILDDITPLRQTSDAALAAPAHVFKPQDAWRFRWNKWTDTPLPPDEPAGQNPPDGAIINYHLKTAARGPVTLEILTTAGQLIRKYSSDDPPEPPVEGRNIPDYWIRPAQTLSADAGLHRFVWDLHYPPPAGASFSYPISAIYMNTPQEPTGTWVMPGTYTVRLTVDGTSLGQLLRVRIDPRVKTPVAGLQQQYTLSMQMYSGAQKAADTMQALRALRAQLQAAKAKAGSGALADTITGVEQKLTAIEGAAAGRVCCMAADMLTIFGIARR